MPAELLTYSLRTALCIAVFYLFFRLLLGRETFHAFNRRLVLAATVLSFLLPLCVITVHRTLPAENVADMTAEMETGNVETAIHASPAEALQAAAAHDVGIRERPAAETAAAASVPGIAGISAEAGMVNLPDDTIQAEESPVRQRREIPWHEIPWRQVAGWIYIAGIVVVAALTLHSVVSLRRLTRCGRRERMADGTTLVRMEGNVAPISWGRNIVISERDLRENGEAILAHERAHIRLHHSLDLLLVDLAGAVQWFNPAMWLLRRDLRAIHEYEADAAVIASGVDARSYQLLLIRKAVGGRWYSIANSFNHSKLKNRITMMLREKSSRWTRARALLFLPLAGLALGAFAETVYVQSESKVTKEFSETNLSGAEIAAGETPVAVRRDNHDAPESRIADPDTVRRHSEAIIFGDKDADLPPELKERIKAYFESEEWQRTTEAIDEAGRKLEEYFNSDEWKQKQQELEKLGEYFESDEWKRKAEEMEEAGRKLEEYFESDEWKRKAEAMEEAGRKLEEYFNSDEWKQKQQEMGKLGEYFESEEWQQTVKEMAEQGADVEKYFDSDEWREAWKHAGQAAQSGDDDYFQSDEWKAIKGKLDAWRAAHDDGVESEWVAEARRDMARDHEALRQDMSETQRRIMETQRKIAGTQEKIRQSGGNDRSVRREIRKTHREMEKVYKEMAQAEEDMAQARQELEQAAREAGQANK